MEPIKSAKEILNSKYKLADTHKELERCSAAYYIREAAEMRGIELFTAESALEAIETYNNQFKGTGVLSFEEFVKAIQYEHGDKTMLKNMYDGYIIGFKQANNVNQEMLEALKSIRRHGIIEFEDNGRPVAGYEEIVSKMGNAIKNAEAK